MKQVINYFVKDEHMITNPFSIDYKEESMKESNKFVKQIKFN